MKYLFLVCAIADVVLPYFGWHTMFSVGAIASSITIDLMHKRGDRA